jgi:hypothetical protein
MRKKRITSGNPIKDFLNASDNAGTTTGITEANFPSKLASSLNYYQRTYNVKDAKEFLIKFRPDVSKFMIGISETQFHPFLTLGYTCKFFLDNQISISFHSETEKWLNEKVEDIKTLKASKKTVAEGETPKHNIQKAIRDQINEKIGEIDAYFDDYIQGIENKLDLIGYIKSCGFPPLHIRKIYNIYKSQWQEFVDRNDDFMEYYSFLTEEDYKNIITFYEVNLEKVDSYIKANSTRRTKTTKKHSIKKLVSKVQYCKNNEELGITSLSPEKILGMTMVLLYNIKYKKLTILKANDISGFSVTGTSIHNYKESNSFCKSVKHDTDFSLFMGTKTLAVTNFDSIEKAPSPANGRLGNDTLILSVFR